MCVVAAAVTYGSSVNASPLFVNHSQIRRAASAGSTAAAASTSEVSVVVPIATAAAAAVSDVDHTHRDADFLHVAGNCLLVVVSFRNNTSASFFLNCTI